MANQVYNDAFYKNRNDETKYSAQRVIDILFKRLYKIPESIVDVGCGVGTWLGTAHLEYGVETVVGLDGDYVPLEYLQIDKDNFIPCNLEDYQTEKILQKNAKGKFDLAISLEVAEHIQRKNARKFVRNLCELSDVILFSAALAKQGGDGHVNEQRLSYWIKLFAENGYQFCDIIRADIWNDNKIPVWYRNNIVVFYNFKKETIRTGDVAVVIDMVHPDLYEAKVKMYEEQIKKLEQDGKLIRLLKDKLKKLKEKIKNSVYCKY